MKKTEYNQIGKTAFPIKLGIGLLMLNILTGCAAVAVGGVGVAVLGVHDRRTTGTIIDDQTTEISAANAIGKIPEAKGAHVNITSYNLRVLITGEVPTHEAGMLVENKVKSLNKVVKVYNELIVAPSASFASRSNDTLITSKVKSVLITVIDPSRIKVVTERGTVNLMGIVTRQEADAVVAKTRTVTGVKDVVHFFEYFTPKK
jgi:osmotically-inducible protein OsmY